jgi:RNA polymerase-binding transcription factor
VSGSEEPTEAKARLDRLAAEMRDEATRRDLATDGDERGDGHHHPAEAATDADQRERDLAAQVRLRQREEQVRLAREALAAGTYGVCVDCGEPIPAARLTVVPDAVRCVPCQSASARRR